MIREVKKERELIMPQGIWSRNFFFVLIILSGLILFPSWGQTQLTSGKVDPKEPWDIEAQELNYDHETEFYTASGNVVIKKGNQILKCDYAQVNRRTMMAMARGHVELTANGDQLTGDEMTVNLEKQTGELKSGRIFLKQNHFYVTGSQIWKTGEFTYKAIDAIVTSCDGERVPWEITAKEFTVTVDGYGQAWHPALRIKTLPVLYSPYMLFPAKTTRQSGLLMPEPGTSSRDGFTINLPIYWAISNQTDATFNEYFMTNRGLIQGAEFRYILSAQSKGALMLDYMPKDNLSQEEFNKGNISAPYNERYWFRSKINQTLPYHIDMKMDLDWVSDRDYLKEFRTTPFGLDRNRRTFLSEYGRDLDDETQVNRRNSAILSKSFGSSNLTGGFNYFQDVDNTGTTLSQMPYARFDMIKQKLGNHFFYQLGSSYNNYWRSSLDRGNVLEITPTVYYPLKVRNYFNLEGSVGLTETVYQTSNRQSTDVDELGNRAVPNFRLDGSTDFQRIFSFSDDEKMKHNIRPQIIYNYTPNIDQLSLPTFITPILQTNTVTYYLTNTLTSKSVQGKDSQGEKIYGYRDFLTFKAYQTYDINAARGAGTNTTTTTTITPTLTTVTTTTTSPNAPPFTTSISSPTINSTNTTSIYTTTTTGQAFSNVFGEIEILPGPYMTLRSTLGWSPYTGNMDSQSYNLTLSDKKGDRAYLEYLSFANDQFRQINADVLWKINPTWTANFLTRYSLDQNKNFQTDLGLAYNQQCWGIKLTYSDTPDNKSFLVSFSLKGLGEF
jgi:LPS-assembly protein